jgi:hypothetical protein
MKSKVSQILEGGVGRQVGKTKNNDNLVVMGGNWYKSK